MSATAANNRPVRRTGPKRTGWVCEAPRYTAGQRERCHVQGYTTQPLTTHSPHRRPHDSPRTHFRSEGLSNPCQQCTRSPSRLCLLCPVRRSSGGFVALTSHRGAKKRGRASSKFGQKRVHSTQLTGYLSKQRIDERNRQRMQTRGHRKAQKRVRVLFFCGKILHIALDGTPSQ